MRPASQKVTSNSGANLPDFDCMDRECRHSVDAFVGRDGERLALYSGIRAQSINRMREYVVDVIGPLAKVRRLVVAGRAIGRTFEDVCAFLAPIHEAAGIDPMPRDGECNGAEVLPAVSDVIREAGEVLASVIERAPDGFTRKEADESCKEIEDVIAKCRVAKAAILAAVETDVTPMRGKLLARRA